MIHCGATVFYQNTDHTLFGSQLKTTNSVETFPQEMYKKDEKQQKTQREMEKRGQQQIDSGCLSKSIYRQEVQNTEKDKMSMVCDKDEVPLAVNCDQIMLTQALLPKLPLFVYVSGFHMSDIN